MIRIAHVASGVLAVRISTLHPVVVRRVAKLGLGDYLT
jgi:hypothetical protein